MASYQAVKKAATLAPTVRTSGAGVPVAPLLNLAARAPADGHAHSHGAASPRTDVPPKWASNVSRSPSSGLVSKTFAIRKFHRSVPIQKRAGR
jgi:ubiquinol-cytochrome c reductase iron-sulfur subunit